MASVLTCPQLLNPAGIAGFFDVHGCLACQLHVRCIDWICSDGPLHAAILSTKPITDGQAVADPRERPGQGRRQPEPTIAVAQPRAAGSTSLGGPETAALESPSIRQEPRATALARLAHAYSWPQAVLALRAPLPASGGQYGWLRGIRLLSITNDADESVWDALLDQGLSVGAVAGPIQMHEVPAEPAAVLAALAFGSYTSGSGVHPQRLVESASGVSWELPPEVMVSVIIRGGFEAARLHGSGSWSDQGNEGSVRLVFQSPQGRCYSQPRIIMPRREPR